MRTWANRLRLVFSRSRTHGRETAKTIDSLLRCRCEYRNVAELRQALTTVSRLSEDELSSVVKHLSCSMNVLRGLVIQCGYSLDALREIESRHVELSERMVEEFIREYRPHVDDYFSIPESSRGALPREIAWWGGAVFILKKLRWSD